MAAAVFLPAGGVSGAYLRLLFGAVGSAPQSLRQGKTLPLAMPPLCKGRWRGGTPRRRGCRYRLRCEFGRVNPSVSLTAASSLSTREPGVRDGHTAHPRICCALSKPSPCGEGFGRGSPGRAEAQRRSPVCVTSGTPSVFLYLRAKCGLIKERKNDRNGASP